MPPPSMTPSGSELRRVRSLIADLDGIAWEMDASSMLFTFVSEGSNDLLGWPSDEWLRNPSFWADHLHPDDRQRLVSRFVRVATAGGAFDEEYRLRAQDGRWVWVRDRGHAVKQAGGKPEVLRGLMTDITGQKLLEDQRAEVEDRFQRVVERLPAIVYVQAIDVRAGATGQMVYVSPQVESILGFTPKEWIEDTVAWGRQFHPDDRESVRAQFDRIAGTGEPFRAEYRMYSRSGDIVWFRDEAVLVRDDDGQPIAWQGIMLNVTEQHESDERVRESEDRYRALVEQLPAIVYSEDAVGAGLQVVYINSRVEALLGITPEEWMADPAIWEGAIHPEDRAAVMAENTRAEQAGEPFSIEYRMVSRDGRLLWFRDEAVLVHDEHGEPRFWQGVMIDITARKEAEARLAEAEARYRALVEQNPTITYLDPIEDDRSTLYMSPQTTAILGYSPEDWYRDPELWSKIVHPDDRPRMEAEVTGGAHSSTYRLIAKDGHEVWVHDQARLIEDEAGQPRLWQGVLVDITQQRRAEELERDLERARVESERLRVEDEVKSTFLQAVSHDLRTPLAAILGLALTMERDDVELEDDERRDMARRIAQNARRLEGIVSDFLDLERLNRGLAHPLYESIDLGATVRDLVANSDLVTDRRLGLEVAPLVVRADPAMMERIVDNLLGNTVKHTPGDSRIWVRVERADDGAVLIVEDDGPGVPIEDRERIFEPFRQGTGAAAGSGVGLALVARFAALHDGRAWVEERPGGGASFHVMLASDPSGTIRLPENDQRAEPDPSSADASQA